jgi:hypothetical protein
MHRMYLSINSASSSSSSAGSSLTLRAVSVHGPKQRLLLSDVLLKGKAVVLVGLLEAWLAARARHAAHVHAQSALQRGLGGEGQGAGGVSNVAGGKLW